MDNPKVILITGCSSGFGLLTAVRLAKRGHLVWATMRDLSKRKRLENELARHKAQVFIRELDVTKPATIRHVVDEVFKTHGQIDVLVNNAGYCAAGFFEDLSDEEIRAQMETNFFGVQNACRVVLPLMRRQKQGKIINISSVAGLTATPCLGAYNASKWALEAFSESLYYEMSLFGVSVSLVEPGLYPTEIFGSNARWPGGADNESGVYFKFNRNVKALVHKAQAKNRRDPEDVARLIEGIVNDPHPRLRTISDLSSWGRVAAQRVLPKRLVAGIFRRLIHADG
jgi:NAD(P)-dependent dehydrogenase (short-subunit alcohol dehydrogenase family)